ncbi:MAG: 4-(cytidine 5'-diphospho)-2-C-methyl-D-erythritol kinase [Puniceicoccaceae bacterium]
MVPDNAPVRINCPAKVNLSLAILGKRDDGFHSLHSVVTQVGLADSLELQWDADGTPIEDTLLIEGAELPTEDNTVSTALRHFREESGFDQGAFRARLVKKIPSGAGLGGGSSDGVGVFRALRQLFGDAVAEIDWEALAGRIGSDCPLFLRDEPVVMEGRGEAIRSLPDDLAARFRGRPLLLFKPRFSINTGEAYRRLAAGGYYGESRGINLLAIRDEAMKSRRARVEEQMRAWETGTDPLPPRWNDFERLVEDWMPSLAVVLSRLRVLHGLDARLSGSGSACFVFPNDQPFDTNAVQKELVEAFGEHFWMQETTIN